MRILVISFYYEPDLSAGSFRTTAFVQALKEQLGERDTIEVVTTLPNRYSTYKVATGEMQILDNVTIRRIRVPFHKSGFSDQARSFLTYFMETLKYTRKRQYDCVFATSSRLFSAFLGAIISRQKNIPLYLDIRDIFVDTLRSVLYKSGLKAVIPLMGLVERFALMRAQKVNLVSKGFAPYFQKKYKKAYSFFPNGIDDEFLDVSFDLTKTEQTDKTVITYTGNIGDGQGLEKIVPQIAERYPDLEFHIIGDGGRKAALKERASHLSNVRILNPVSRKELVSFYRQSDMVFLHLNNYEAFKKVLPSKIFEYAATRKPIIAGVEGYAKEFLEENLPDSLVFRPCDIEDFCRKYDRFKRAVDQEKRQLFIARFTRAEIMKEMARDFLGIATQ
ncbi:MAG: glycosyltransferase family 4 protein [Nitrospirae bacterium]|nr:glycosyltransferase family 4 protein [Nitrospirota bacterium]